MWEQNKFYFIRDATYEMEDQVEKEMNTPVKWRILVTRILNSR